MNEEAKADMMLSQRRKALLPCPLCGGEAIDGMSVSEGGGVYCDRWSIGCARCDMKLIVQQEDDSEWPYGVVNRAFDKWNTRVEHVARDETDMNEESKREADSTIQKIRALPEAGVMVVHVGKEVELTALGTVELNEFADRYEAAIGQARGRDPKLDDAVRSVRRLIDDLVAGEISGDGYYKSEERGDLANNLRLILDNINPQQWVATEDEFKVLKRELQAENDKLPGPYVRQVTLDRVRQSDGSDKWAVRRGSECLTKQGGWEYEPMPSSRTDEFIALTRFDSENEAVEAWTHRQEKP